MAKITLYIKLPAFGKVPTATAVILPSSTVATSSLSLDHTTNVLVASSCVTVATKV